MVKEHFRGIRSMHNMKIGIENVHLFKCVYNYNFNSSSQQGAFPYELGTVYSIYEDFQTRLLIMEWASVVGALLMKLHCIPIRRTI